MSSHQLNSKNNDLVLLLKTVWRYWNCFLSPGATDGRMEVDLKWKLGEFFRVLMLLVQKIPKKFIMVSRLWQNSFDIFVVAFQKHFVFWLLSLEVLILAQNWPKTAKASWQCPFNSYVTGKSVFRELKALAMVTPMWFCRDWLRNVNQNLLFFDMKFSVIVFVVAAEW